MAARSSPTVRKRQLGALLRNYRTGAGLSVKEAADRLLCSPTKISRMESGERSTSLRDLRDLSGIYGIQDPAEVERLATLVREGQQRGWWQSLDLDPAFSTYVGLEAGASRIFEYQSSFVPGLLQTAAYARALITANIPESTARIDKAVEARATRQETLLVNSDSLHFWAVLDESVLRHHVGGVEVLSEQLKRLVEFASFPQVTMQVIPFVAAGHPALDSSFVYLEFEQPEVSSVVYLENLAGQFFVETDDEIARYRRTSERLRAVARSPEDSVRMIEQSIESL